MRTDLTSKVVAKLGAYFLIGGGALSALSLLLPSDPAVNRPVVLINSAVAIVVGTLVYVAPWDRWPRRAMLGLLPVAFAQISLGNYYGSAGQAYTYSLFFVVAFAWIGIGHARWTSVWFAPLAAIAYVAPILIRPNHSAGAVGSAVIAIPVCVLVGESLSWISAGERRSRVTAQSLARVSQTLGRHLRQPALGESLVQEARAALNAEHAILYQLDTDTRTITDIFGANVSEQTMNGLASLRGRRYDNLPRFDHLSTGRPLVVEDVTNSPADADLEVFRVKSYVAMPVMAEEELVGILWCSETTEQRRYRHEELDLAGALAAQASAAFQNARLYEQTLKASRTDSLTGLPNRRAFREHLTAEVERARRHTRALSLVLVDTDTLKKVNDEWGHAAGDRVLVRLARVLDTERRPEDLAFRLGGDEFALLLPETDPTGALTFAERLRRRVSHERLGVGEDLLLTVSMGISSFPDHATVADELFERADTAMYEVKRSGANAVAVAGSLEVLPGVRFGVDIRKVIEDETMVPWYQPIFDLANGEVVGYETFCRLDPEVGTTPTLSLFRAAAGLGLLRELDECCRTIAIQGAKELIGDLLLFVNVSPAAIEAPGAVSRLVDVLTDSGLSLDQIVMEITEHERSPSSEPFQAALSELQRSGLRIALDDFGTAGADLELLAHVNFDFVKVDTSFVHNANGQDSRRRVLRSLQVVAHEIDAYTIAEGVETLDDLRLVRELGFHAAQGFFLKHPAPAIEVLRPFPMEDAGGPVTPARRAP